MQIIKKTLIIATLIMTASGCYYDNLEELYPIQDCNTTNLTYDNGIKTLIDKSCATAGCHVAGTGRVMLTTYPEVKVIVDDGRLEDRVLIKKNMPPGIPLSECEMNQLQSWLNAGAPEK